MKKDIDAELLHKGEYLRLLRRAHWEYVERINSWGVAVLVAVTPEGKLLLVEQYRWPVAAPVIELPAGLVGDVDGEESMAAAARRELLEETGYSAGEIEVICTGPVTAGLSNEQTTFCIARNLSREGPGGGDHTEDIRVHEVPLADVGRWLDAASERAQIDPKIYIGLWLLREHSSR
jgi:ADP-ribose diphosphatase